MLQDTILEFPCFSINSTKGILYLGILDKSSKMRKYIHVSVQTHTFVILMMLCANKCGYILTGSGMVSPSFKWTGFRPVLQDTILEFPYFSINSIKGILYLGILDKGSKMRIYTYICANPYICNFDDVMCK